MKKALMIAPAASVFLSFCNKNTEALKKLGYDIYLVSNFYDKDEKKREKYLKFAEECRKNGIKTIDIAFRRKSFFKNLKYIMDLKALIRSENFDLIHAHTETGGLIAGIALPAKNKAKKIYTPHGISFYKGSSLLSWCLYYPAERWICSRFDCVLAINGEEYGIIHKWKKDKAVFVHGVGVDIGRFENQSVDIRETREEFSIKPEDFMILCIGELNRNKNHKVIIEAVSKIQDPNVKCIICGAGELKESLRTMITELGLADRVFLAGYRTDIPQLLAAADIFAFPSYHEGLPVSVMEAMASGLPVVCSRIRGNTDLIKDGEGGFLCSPESAEQFREAIERLLKDRKLREKMSAVNKKTVMEYDAAEVEKELEYIYSGKSL